jgi:hypothetical protein
MDHAPNWYSVNGRVNGSVDGLCVVVDESATKDREYSVTIEQIGEAVYARETRPGEKLPKVCYDRHIMPNGFFCLGLSAGHLVKDAGSARDWWSNLSQFLRLQGVATSTGRWPRAMELDHGQAGHYHRRALDAAAKLGVSEDYELALLGKPSWTTSLLSGDGMHVINGRAPCPVGCTRKGRNILRGECCAKDSLLELLRNERLRAISLDRFWENVRTNEQMACCGTMISCPLRAA